MAYRQGLGGGRRLARTGGTRLRPGLRAWWQMPQAAQQQQHQQKRQLPPVLAMIRDARLRAFHAQLQGVDAQVRAWKDAVAKALDEPPAPTDPYSTDTNGDTTTTEPAPAAPPVVVPSDQPPGVPAVAEPAVVSNQAMFRAFDQLDTRTDFDDEGYPYARPVNQLLSDMGHGTVYKAHLIAAYDTYVHERAGAERGFTQATPSGDVTPTRSQLHGAFDALTRKSDYTATGVPKVVAVKRQLGGIDVSADEVKAAWTSYSAGQ
jgi:hypothetical protein